MEEMNQKVEGIRRILDDLRLEKNAVVNKTTAALEPYPKELYLKFLCTVVQYENTPTEAQLLYLKRLISGVKADVTLEDCMRRALELSDADVTEFLDGMKPPVGYYFALEGIVLAAVGEPGDACFEYLAELIELIGIRRQELETLCLVAKSIVRQDSSLFDEAKAGMSDSLKRLNYLPYVRNYYAGTTIDTETEVCYTSPDNQVSYKIDFPSEYQRKQVTFDRVSLVIDKVWNFRNCKSITFRNCCLEGAGGRLDIQSAETVLFENCTFRNFKNRVAHLTEVKDFISDHCEYVSCGYLTHGNEYGGVLYASSPENASITLTGNKLLRCFIGANTMRSGWGVSGVFWGTYEYGNDLSLATIKDNEFRDCRCINNGNYIPAMIAPLDASEIDISGNICTGEVTKVLENETLL